LLTFTSVYFFESRLFKGFRPIQTKKIPGLPSQVVPSYLKPISATFVFSLFGACQGAGPTWRVVNGIAQLSAFTKKKSQLFCWPRFRPVDERASGRPKNGLGLAAGRDEARRMTCARRDGSLEKPVAIGEQDDDIGPMAASVPKTDSRFKLSFVVQSPCLLVA
jgi:hypothetical protein